MTTPTAPTRVPSRWGKHLGPNWTTTQFRVRLALASTIAAAAVAWSIDGPVSAALAGTAIALRAATKPEPPTLIVILAVIVLLGVTTVTTGPLFLAGSGAGIVLGAGLLASPEHRA
ncbi:hypothetical protein BIV57_17895 [Mangrovactinospora gilvigrisea]|uniref:Uncharacterized protein n=1 Tax=Mangrovactinospora gilvigrisea TaxID=1428644 RepID=A0A1J7BBV1_9ACTN|nr:hypothetical protein [Mangrovactinospora gilvigrisea]OIV36110.1 hypothetical protein BIV57_17895 [Mangrovactinospora gilvigrisea]